MYGVGTKLQQSVLGHAVVPQGPAPQAPLGEVTLGEIDYTLVTMTPHERTDVASRFGASKVRSTSYHSFISFRLSSK